MVCYGTSNVHLRKTLLGHVTHNITDMYPYFAAMFANELDHLGIHNVSCAATIYTFESKINRIILIVDPI